jgi:hypothetical protein
MESFCLRFGVGRRWRGAPVFRSRFVTGKVPVSAGTEPSKTGAGLPEKEAFRYFRGSGRQMGVP